MATHALDVVTILHALNTLEEEFLGPDRQWGAHNELQQKLLALYARYGALAKVHGLKAKASTDWQVLNKFLVDERFDPEFGPFDGIGVASILDKLVNWLEGKATLCLINAHNQEYPGFELEPFGAAVYLPSEFPGSLAMIKTRSEDTLWLYLPHPTVNLNHLDMVQMALDIHLGFKRVDEHYAGVQIPKVDFSVKPDLSFLLGTDTHDRDGGYWVIAKPFSSSSSG
jgi:hypothetical protein